MVFLEVIFQIKNNNFPDKFNKPIAKRTLAIDWKEYYGRLKDVKTLNVKEN